MGQLMLSMLSAAMEGRRDVDLVLDPQARVVAFVEPAGRIVQVQVANPVIRGVPVPSGGAAMGIGAVVVLFGQVAESLAQEQAVQTLVGAMAEAVPPMVQAARRYAEGDCETCVRNSVWGQSTPRGYVTETHQKRL